MIRKVSFEHVSAIAHPEYYYGNGPAVRPEEVPDEHWTLTERVGDDVDAQYRGLLELMGRGELIRNPHLYEGDVLAEVEWREIKPWTGDQAAADAAKLIGEAIQAGSDD